MVEGRFTYSASTANAIGLAPYVAPNCVRSINRCGSIQRSAGLLDALLALLKLFEALPPELELGLTGCSWHAAFVCVNLKKINIGQREGRFPGIPLAAASDIAKQRADNDRQWKHRLERIDYETELARRSYAAVDPEHRLVARQLELRWDEKLSAQETLHQEYRRFAVDQPNKLLASEREKIHSLSKNIESLWRAVTTTSEDRKTIARLLLDRVVVSVNPTNEQLL